METNLLVEHIKLLKAGKMVDCPIYDYSQHYRSKETVRIEPRKVILIKGILALQNDALRDLLDIKVYVEADTDKCTMRRGRAIRDIKERRRDLEDIFEQYVTTVKPMHNLYVEPTKATADIVINSGMNDVAFDMVKTKINELLRSK